LKRGKIGAVRHSFQGIRRRELVKGDAAQGGAADLAP